MGSTVVVHQQSSMNSRGTADSTHNATRVDSLACPRVQALRQALHARPWDAELWALHALLAAQLAAVHPAAHRCRAAEISCTAALAAVQRAGMPVGRYNPCQHPRSVQQWRCACSWVWLLQQSLWQAVKVSCCMREPGLHKCRS